MQFTTAPSRHNVAIWLVTYHSPRVMLFIFFQDFDSPQLQSPAVPYHFTQQSGSLAGNARPIEAGPAMPTPHGAAMPDDSNVNGPSRHAGFGWDRGRRHPPRINGGRFAGGGMHGPTARYVNFETGVTSGPPVAVQSGAGPSGHSGGGAMAPHVAPMSVHDGTFGGWHAHTAPANASFPRGPHSDHPHFTANGGAPPARYGVRGNHPGCVVLVTGVDQQASIDSVFNLFSVYGTISKIKRLKHGKADHALIEFSPSEFCRTPELHTEALVFAQIRPGCSLALSALRSRGR